MAVDIYSARADDASNIETHRSGFGVMILALAVMVGIAAADHFSTFCIACIWPMIAAAGVLLVAIVIARCRLPDQHRYVMALLALVAMILSGAWYTMRQQYNEPNDLAALIGDQATYIHAQGVALGPPVLRQRIGGAMAKFDYRQPATYFPMRIDSLIERGGTPQAIKGKVLVRVDETVPPFRAGDHVEAKGFLLRPAPPRNPGEFDYREYAKSLGQAGFLTVSGREVLTITKAERATVYETFLNWRDELRRRAGAWLLSELPQNARTERDSLLSALLLGQRDEQIDGVQSAFQRVGLAHVLAISGFHLGVLAGFVLLGLRIASGQQRWHGIVVIVFVLIYLLLVEMRMPVLRAGVMTIAASIGIVCARRFHVGGLCALSAIALLLWRPDQLFNAGFQLTFGVVSGLIYLAPGARTRWFGRHNPEAASTGEMVRQWLYTALTAAITSWLIALPIVMYHFGFISPLGVLLSVITFPLAALILAFGFLKMVFAAWLPSLGLLLGVPLSIFTDVLVAVVMTVDQLPWSFVPVPTPSIAWAFAALLVACWWLRGDLWLHRLRTRIVAHINGQRTDRDILPFRRTRHKGIQFTRWLATACLAVWLMWPPSFTATLRLDMLSVGDGSCYVIRDAQSTVVFDAGSSTDLNVARRSLIPAMRRLGVRSIDAIVISHADLDHYSAVVELAEEFSIQEVLVTPQFLEESRTVHDGPAAFAMQRLVELRLLITPIDAGAVRRFGQNTWTWLHPPALTEFKRGNDGSMVVAIDCGERRVLMCGDIQREAMEQLMQTHADQLHADIIELPHHGSYNETADKFIKRLDPKVVMQSTGWMRWQRDRWAKTLQDTERLITARDGASWVEIHHDGSIQTGRFIAPGTLTAMPSSEFRE